MFTGPIWDLMMSSVADNNPMDLVSKLKEAISGHRSYLKEIQTIRGLTDLCKCEIQKSLDKKTSFNITYIGQF